MNRFLFVLLFAACAGQARPLEGDQGHDSRLDPPRTDNSGEWAYIAIPNDREFDFLAPITGGSHDPKEMPAGNIGTPAPEEAANVETTMKIKKCNVDDDCPSRACLRPDGGPHPFGVCGEAVDHLGRPTPNRTVRSCGEHHPCPGNARCVLAYEDYGMCFR